MSSSSSFNSSDEKLVVVVMAVKKVVLRWREVKKAKKEGHDISGEEVKVGP